MYSPSTWDLHESGNSTPKVLDIIDHGRALNMAFVVRFVEWNPKYSNAFGIVIKAFPKGYNHLNAELLLSIIHSVPFESSCNEQDVSLPVSTSHSSHNDDTIFRNAFTIDPKDARNLDDALTLYKLKDSDSTIEYEFSVHIVNAAKHVPLQSNRDQDALKKGTAYYYKSCGKTKMIPMLPSDLLDELSLTPGNVRDVWSVSCHVVADRNGNVMRTSNASIMPAKMCSILQLSYEEAQGILSGTYHSESISEFDSFSSISLKDIFTVLYSLSLHFAEFRVHNDGMYGYNGNKSEDLSCWQAHKLIQEFMIWANNEVAKRLYDANPVGVLLRCQKPPNQRRLDDFKADMSDFLSMSFDLCRHDTDGSGSNLQSFKVSKSVLELMKKKKSERDPIGASGIIMSDCLFPQLLVASSKRIIISRKSEYCVTKQGVSKREYSHYSLNLETYTHFTSPLRRYADIIVQRLLSEDYEDSDIEVDELCKRINECSMKASSFEKDTAKVDFSLTTMFNNQIYQACIERNTKSKIYLSLLSIELSHLFHDVSIRVASLGPFMSKHSKIKYLADQKYSWRVKVTSLSKMSLDNIGCSAISNDKEQCTALVQAYKSSGEALQLVHFKVDVESLCVSISQKDWKSIMNFAKDPSVDQLACLDLPDNNRQQSTLGCSTGVEIGTTEYPFMNHILTLSLEESELFNIWMNMRKKKCLPETIVQMIELSPLFRVCVQHNTHPAHCFSDFFLKQASLPRYRSIAEYVELWQSVLLAEAAVASVHEAQPFIIRDVQLTWPQFTLCPTSTDGSFSYMIKDKIKWKVPKAFMEIMFEYFKAKVGDLVCARYGCNGGEHRKVFHFVIRHVEKANEESKEIDDLLIKMGLCKQENKFSEDMKNILENTSEITTCEVQIINMCQSHRYIMCISPYQVPIIFSLKG